MLGVFLVLLLCLTMGAAKKGQGTAAIEIIEKTYNFGQVSQGADITHDFKVLNKGNAPLEIKSVKPG